MNSLEGLYYGFAVALTLENLTAAMVGAVLGTFVGVLPGIGPLGALAILLMATPWVQPVTAIIMLAGIYYGAMYGGSTTSILVNVPGEAASVVTALEGYQMAQRGRAGAALAVAAVGSFLAGTAGVIVLMVVAPPLARLALAFGPPEYFAIALLGLFALGRLSSGSLWRNILVLAFGMMLSTVGMDPVSGAFRYTFGINIVTQGIETIAVAMGLFGVAEVLLIAEQSGGLPQITTFKFRELFPTRKEWNRALPAIARGSGIGVFLGLIPGPACFLSAFSSYNLERHMSKGNEEFGKGAIEGVAGPEAANNAAASSTLVPLLGLGLPFSPVTALLLAALMIHGVQPGPLLIQEHPEVFWGVVASMYIGNAALLVLNFPLVGLWVSLLRIPQQLLCALILIFMLVGTYSMNNSILDLLVLVIMGIIGYVLRKLDFDVSPMIVALVLGPMIERTFRQSLFMTGGDFSVFTSRPITVTILLILLAILIIPALWHLARARLAPGSSRTGKTIS
jgi:putative tricarboxylic transport membrane protein